MRKPCKLGHTEHYADGKCKVCARERAAKWAAENPEQRRVTGRAWRVANPEKARRDAIAWRAANLDRHREGERIRKGLPRPTRPCPAVCECCGKPPGKHSLGLDHCHVTGVFRGWLCSKCNPAIGALGDTVEGLMRAVAYLRFVI